MSDLDNVLYLIGMLDSTWGLRAGRVNRDDGTFAIMVTNDRVRGRLLVEAATVKIKTIAGTRERPGYRICEVFTVYDNAAGLEDADSRELLLVTGAVEVVKELIGLFAKNEVETELTEMHDEKTRAEYNKYQNRRGENV